MWHSAWCHSDHFIYWSTKQKRQREAADHPLLSPLGLNVKSWHTQTHRDVSESSSRVKNFTAKFQTKLIFFFCSSRANSVSYTLFTPLSLLTADTKSNGKVHTYIFVAGGRRWRDMRSTSGQQLGASNWRGFVSVAHSSPWGNTSSGLVWLRATVQSVKWLKNSSL